MKCDHIAPGPPAGFPAGLDIAVVMVALQSYTRLLRPAIAMQGRLKISDRLTLSTVALEVDRRPVLASRCRKYFEAEGIYADERVGAKLCTIAFELAAIRF